MENAKVVHILHIALLEIQGGTVLFRQEVQSVECLGLGFADRRDILGSGLSQESREIASCVLDDDPFRGSDSGWLIIQKWTESEGLGWVVEAESR